MYTDKVAKVSVSEKLFHVLITLSWIINQATTSTTTDIVCIGDQLTLTCSTNGTSLRWSVSNPRIVVIGVNDQLISSTGPERRGPFVTSLGVFIFYRTSISPLMSVLEIVNITADLNDTRVDCEHVEGMSTTAITVIQNEVVHNAAMPIIMSEIFKSENIKVNITWTQEYDVMYNVTTAPHTPHIKKLTFNNGSVNVIELTLSYNTVYNVSITGNAVANGVCRAPQTSVSFKLLSYVKCGYPLDLPSGLVRDSTLVQGYMDPALVGTTVNISCPYGNVLSQSDTTTIICTENAEWEPDPTGMRCRVDCRAPSVSNNDDIIVNYTSTLEDSLLELRCREGLIPSDVLVAVCHHSGVWIPDPVNHKCYDITVLALDQNAVIAIVVLSTLIIVSSIIFFLIGCLCGWFGHKRKKSSTNETETVSLQQATPTPAYEDVLLTTRIASDKEKAFELEENVAYGRARPK